MNRKILILPTIALMLAAAFFLASGANPPARAGLPAASDAVRVGVILPLTGYAASIGTAMAQGVELASDALNAQGYAYDLLVEDDQLEPPKTVSAARKLLDVDGIDAGMVFGLNVSRSVEPLFGDAHVPYFVLFDAYPEDGRSDYFFSIGFSTDRAGEMMAEFAYQKLGARTAAVVYMQDEWSATIQKRFANRFEALGGRVVVQEQVQFAETDYRTMVAKVRGADVVYAPLLSTLHVFWKQLRESGYEGSILSGDSATVDELAAAGQASEGIYLANVYLPDSPKARALGAAYRKRYGHEPELLVFTALGYDAMMAIHEARLSDGGNIQQGLRRLRMDGVTGPITFDENGLSPRFERVFVIRDGNAVLVDWP